MALDPAILRKLRHEIGDDAEAGVADDATLETIFNDVDEGNSSVLATALIVWRHRLHNMQARSFDMTSGGSLMARSQRIKFIERRIKELEEPADDTDRAQNVVLLTSGEVSGEIDAGTEFS